MEFKDPRQYIDTYFGTRNNIEGKPVENVNYTLETLTYMTSHNRADQITQMIVDRMNNLGFNMPFRLFECCAGIGGNTLSFLENPGIELVVSYEVLPERREMLLKNIGMYEMYSKSYVMTTPFEGVPKDHENVVLYFDPPWLPPHIPGDKSTKADYILSDIHVGDKSLEEWVTSCPNCAMVVARVPPGYRLKPIPGYNVEERLLKNSLVLFITKEGLENTTGVSILPYGVEEYEREWYDGLKVFIDNLLSMIIPNPQQRSMMTTDEAMKIWVPCFTHESYNRNVGSNYEELELVGDHAMEYNFMMHMYLNDKSYTRSQLSELKSNYMSKTFQASIGQKFGLGKWLRIVVPLNTHVFEDVLEAFFGGLNIVGDTVFKFGTGNGLCFNLIARIFEGIKLDMKKATSKPKTKIKELFETLPWGPRDGPKSEWKKKAFPIINAVDNIDGSVTVTVSYTNEALQWLAEMGLNNVDPLLSTSTGTTKTVAFEEAYKIALGKIRDMGITDEWIERWRETRDWNKPELVSYIPSVIEKTKRNGYERFYIAKASKPGKDKKINYQLIGVKPDGRLDILSTTHATSDVMSGKQEALTLYLESK